MTMLISNARMYAVTPETEAAWRDLLDRVTRGSAETVEELDLAAMVDVASANRMRRMRGMWFALSNKPAFLPTPTSVPNSRSRWR